jgi:hypothetical protein
MVLMEDYGARPARVTVSRFRAKVIKSLRLMTCGSLYSFETLLRWLSDPDHRPCPRLWYNRSNAPHGGRATWAVQQSVGAFPRSPTPAGGPPPAHGEPRCRGYASTARRWRSPMRLALSGSDAPKRFPMRLCDVSCSLTRGQGRKGLASGCFWAHVPPPHDGKEPHGQNSGGAEPRGPGRLDGGRTP